MIVAAISSTVAGLARAQALEAERGARRPIGRWQSWRRWREERDRMQAEMVEAEALRRSDELKTALLRSISHDLRTPLTSIIAGGAALGSSSHDGEERGELSAAVVAEGERLSRLVENLLDMSRLEAGKAEPHASRSTWPRCSRPPGQRSGGRGSCASRSTASCRWSTPTPPSSSAPSPTCSRTRSATAAADR